METTLRPNTSAASAGATIGPAVAPNGPARPAATQPINNAPDNASAASPANASDTAPLRSKATSVDGGLQDQVARAQQATDYLSRVASQLEALKGELTAKLSGATASREKSPCGERRESPAVRYSSTSISASAAAPAA